MYNILIRQHSLTCPRFTYLIPALTYHFYLSLLPDSHNLGHTFSRSQFTIVSLCVIQLLCHTFFSPAVESQTRTRWTSLYFTPVFSVLLYNVGDLVGRSTATWLKWPGRKAKERYALLVVTILRIGMKHKQRQLSRPTARTRHAPVFQLSLEATGCSVHFAKSSPDVIANDQSSTSSS